MAKVTVDQALAEMEAAFQKDAKQNREAFESVRDGLVIPIMGLGLVDDVETTPELKDKLGMDVFGRTFTDAVKRGICISCGDPPGVFSSKLNKREFEITRLCEECQDDHMGLRIKRGDGK